MKKLKCKITGHRFVSIKKSNSVTKEYQCTCCKQKFTEDGYGQIIRLTKYWEENNLLLEKYFADNKAI